MKHLRWLLNCTDNGTSIELENDPVGWEQCTYRMERHKIYQGIFNQFTAPLKFHNEGGGKQFIDSVYNQYDIDGNITITILVDTDGRGINYDTLFTGKLNLASWQTDGTFTTVNIEASDLITKLNTRAEIPVPINLPTIQAGYYSASGGWISYTFQGVLLQEYHNNGDASGTYTFQNQFIQPGKTFYAVSLDVNNNPITASVIFNNDTNPTNGTQTGAGTLQLSVSSVTTGELTIAFTNVNQTVQLYMVGYTQLSLGQQHIQAVQPKTLYLTGIPIQYESTFSMVGTVNSGDITFSPADDNWTSLATINTGDYISAICYDIDGNILYSTVLYPGSSVMGNLAISGDGATTIQITACAPTSVNVHYTNAFGYIYLFRGSAASLLDSAGSGLPPGDPLDFTLPEITGSEQDFEVPNNAYVDGNVFGGFCQFDTVTIFDNLNEFILSRFCDVDKNPNNHDNSNTAMPPIFDGFNEAYISYPVNVGYRIKLKGNFTEELGISAHRTYTFTFVLAYGPKLDDGSTTRITLQTTSGDTTDLNISWPFDFDQSDTISLKPNDKIWFHFYITEQFLEGPISSTVIPLKFNFTNTLIDFTINEYAVPTTCSSIMVHEAFTQVVDSIADSDNNFYSEYYGRTDSQKRTYDENGEGAFRALNNGLCVRGHTDKNITFTLLDLFNSISAIDNIGLEVDPQNRVRVEKIEHFFNTSNKIIELPYVNTFDTLNENSYYYNQIEIGYDKAETELYFKNGLDEVHGRRNFATRIGSAKGTVLTNTVAPKTSNKLGKVAKLIAGNYAIELTRRKNLHWAHDDFKYDNDNFIFELDNVFHVKNGSFHAFSSYNLIQLGTNITGLKWGDIITVSGSASNNGTYTVISQTGSSVRVVETVTDEGPVPFTVSTTTNYCLQTGGGLLQQPVRGVLNPGFADNWMNMGLTPARMLQANANWITPSLQKIKGNIQFINGTGNYHATTQMYSTGNEHDYTGYVLGENTSLVWNNEHVRNIQPLWLPEVYRFQYPLTYAQFKHILANPNGYISFYKFSNEEKKGFILSMDYNLKTGLTKFELLRMFE